MAASAISATLSFNTSVPCKKQHRLGASIFSPQQFSGSNAHWHPSANLKSRTPLPKLRAANRVVVAQAGTYKVAILGAGGGIGQALSLLVKMSPLVSTLHLYDDTADAKGVAADLSHCNTPAQVAGFTGRDELAGSVSGADVVVFLADATPDDDSFAANAGVVKEPAEAVADHAPGALVHVVAGPVDSTVPVAAEVLKRKGAYVQSQLVPELPFFACRVKLGRDGVEEVVGSELRGLSDYEARALDALKPQLRASIDRGVAYVQQQPATASLN
jgi:malate dehydrogenase